MRDARAEHVPTASNVVRVPTGAIANRAVSGFVGDDCVMSPLTDEDTPRDRDFL